MAKRSLGKAAPDGSLKAFPSAVMMFAVLTEEPLAAMESESSGRRSNSTSIAFQTPVQA